MPDPIVMAKAAALAAFVTALATWLLGRLSRPLGGPLGAGLGILAGAWALGLAPRVSQGTRLRAAAAGPRSGAILAECVASLRLGWLMRLAVAAGAVPVLVHGSSYVADLSGPGTREWSPGLAAGLFAGLAAALFLSWTAARPARAAQPDIRGPRVGRNGRRGGDHDHALGYAGGGGGTARCAAGGRRGDGRSAGPCGGPAPPPRGPEPRRPRASA